MTGVLFVGILVLLVGGVILYNGLVRLRVRSDEAWSDIEAQLKRRYDLIPNLVEAVRGYASHERGLFEKVAELRSRAIAAPGPREKGAAEGELTQALRTLFAVAENYPELRASENFLQLQQHLAEVEEQIQLSRRYYNAVVRDLNTRIWMFPSNLIASWFGFKEREFFELEAPEERRPVRVQF